MAKCLSRQALQKAQELPAPGAAAIQAPAGLVQQLDAHQDCQVVCKPDDGRATAGEEADGGVLVVDNNVGCFFVAPKI